MKYLYVEMPNGEWWKLPCAIIASDRAMYFSKRYAEKNGLNFEEQQKVYKTEYKYTMNDEYEIFDWASNNMNWTDVKDFAICVGSSPLNQREFQKGWINGNKKIINEETNGRGEIDEV